MQMTQLFILSIISIFSLSPIALSLNFIVALNLSVHATFIQLFFIIFGIFLSVSTRTWGWVDNEKVERRLAATEVSTGREEERLTKSTVLFNEWLILCHTAVQNIQPKYKTASNPDSFYLRTHANTGILMQPKSAPATS
jgi:hypothetical protein